MSENGTDIPTLDQYKYFQPITTRWKDNDSYGHVNNVAYYSYFDTTVCHFLMTQAGLDIENSTEIGFVVNSSCHYVKPLAFPDTLVGALRVNRIGNSSVEYGLGIFLEGEQEAAAHGHFIHVFVERESGKPTRIPDYLRNAFEQLVL